MPTTFLRQSYTRPLRLEFADGPSPEGLYGRSRIGTHRPAPGAASVRQEGSRIAGHFGLSPWSRKKTDSLALWKAVENPGVPRALRGHLGQADPSPELSLEEEAVSLVAALPEADRPSFEERAQACSEIMDRADLFQLSAEERRALTEECWGELVADLKKPAAPTTVLLIGTGVAVFLAVLMS